MKAVPDAERCQGHVYHRDCYRRTGRGPSGFTMHYNRERCKRRAGTNGFCWQHSWKGAMELRYLEGK